MAEDLILAKIPRLTKSEASALISQLDRQDFSFFGTAAPAMRPARSAPQSEALEPHTDGTPKANEQLAPMTDARFKTIGEMIAEKNVSQAQVETLPQHFSKEQASHLMTQMTEHDWSAIDQVKDDGVPATMGGGLPSSPTNSEGVEF